MTHVLRRMSGLVFVFVLVVVPQQLASAEPRQVVIGMPFAGKWARDAHVPPPYSDMNSSHPSVHLSPGGGDWGTDLYGVEGQPVRLRVPYAGGSLGFGRVASSTSCGQSLRVTVSVNGVTVGWLYFAHLNNVPNGAISNGMVIGTMHDWGCNPGLHAHVEFKNVTNFSCYVDRGSPGTTVGESEALGVLGSTNGGPRQSCAAVPGESLYPETAAPPASFGKGDLYFIKTRNTPSGNVEVHSATRASDYQSGDLHQATRFSSADAGNGTFQMVGRKLYFIKTRNTGSGRVEVHTATESSGYQSADLAVATTFTVAEGDLGTWQLANINHDGYVDLVFIKTVATASGKVEVFAAFGGPDHFQSLSLAKASRFDVADSGNGRFQIQNADLTFIKTRATGSGRIEYFRATIGSDFQSLVEATATHFSSAEAGSGWFSTVDTNGDNGADLVLVKTRATGSGRIEVFAVTGTAYQVLLTAKATEISATEADNGQWQLDNGE